MTADGAFGLLNGRSPVMQRVFRMIRRVAPTPVTVLICGESGTGKELAARSIHELSDRKAEPFIAVNCGAISGELIESELFGHCKGAFTGAHRSHRGYFEQADGGTLFLDEVTEMSQELQVRLLRAIESGAARKVGGERDYRFDARILASTNRDAEVAVAQGVLREDLYYRLAEFPIRMPALRERGDDVLLLARLFLRSLNQRSGKHKSLSVEAEELLRLHRWPGNIRELRNALRRAFILSDGEIGARDLPARISAGGESSGDSLHVAIGQSLADIERRVILTTLDHCEDNKRAAAELLGISLKTLYNRLNKYRQG